MDAYQPGAKARVETGVKIVPPQPESQPKPESQPEVKTPHIFSVSEITGDLKTLIERNFKDVWICGEVTDFRNRTGRHYYFALKDEKNKVRSVIFNAASRRIPFELKDGLEVVCHGSLDVYGPAGYYSIIIDHIEPKGIGALQLAFEQLKKKLQAEGLFSAERKQPIPYLPRKVGVITSPTGAAIRDIVHVMTRRFPNIEILLYPVRVQGNESAGEIADAIRAMNGIADLDVLIIGRGGGSIEDLWAFNEEVVARAIAASELPIISAVGHEIDFTISDFVADLRAPTPSAAAEMVVPVRSELLNTIADRKKQLVYALKQGLHRRFQELGKVAGRIRDPRRRFPDLMRSIDALSQRLAFVMKSTYETRVQHLAKLASNMDHLSPLGVLAKGYSVAEDSKGSVIKSSKPLKVGDALKLRFHKGSALAKVSKVID
ncbi:MAG: exodeoxyribonuclease VII large subunit [Deltaproteobacteria bacterium]|nr:exodeoxyribonuclease VII large subunit [Deltaproteobacteria bacterium]